MEGKPRKGHSHVPTNSGTLKCNEPFGGHGTDPCFWWEAADGDRKNIMKAGKVRN